MKIVKLKLKADSGVNAGTYNVILRYTYFGQSTPIQVSIPIEIDTSQTAEVIHIDKTTLVPGEETSLKFKIGPKH